MDISSILLLVVASILWHETWADDKTSCNCGWVNKGRIVGGKAAQKHQFPWMAALWGQDKVLCGATIITKRHAITSAHCNIHKDLVLVVGLHDTRKYYICSNENSVTTIPIEKRITHPGFKQSEDSVKDDIAVFVTKLEIPFSSNVGPACLPTGPINLDHKGVLAIGWGLDGDSKDPPFILQHVNLTILEHRECLEYWGDTLEDPPTQLCTLQGKSGTCLGDSGGPLVWLDPKSKRYILVGVPSFVIEGCEFPPPAVFADVTKYIPWIKETIKEHRPTEVCSKT